MSQLRSLLACLVVAMAAFLPGVSLADSAEDPWGNARPMLFGTAHCPYCNAARAWFAKNKVAYSDCDIEKNKECRNNYLQLRQKLGVSGVPVFVYRGEVWTGYAPEQMAEIVASGNR